MISIAMATYNGEKYLREQLDSILAQTVQDFELVVCDDCSTDSTVRILEEYVEKDARIKIFCNEQNLGFVKNFEKAISLCQGEYIALSDQDDVWLPEHLQVLLENIGEKDLCGADAMLVDKELNPIGTTLFNTSHFDVLPSEKQNWLFFLLHNNIFQGAAILFKKALTEKALPFPPGIKFHDWWLALIACANGGVAYTKTCVLNYRQHGNNEIGGEKYSRKIFDAIFLSDKQKDLNKHGFIAKENITKAFASKTADEYQRREALAAAEYFENLRRKRRIKYLPYFIKNHFLLNRSKRLTDFAMRLLKYIAGWW